MTDTKQKSDLSRAFSEDGALKTHVGGQALLEGIMMRGKYNWAVAVREPEGTIYTEEHDLASGKDKNGWLYWPFVRGCRAFVESLTLGYKALSIAAEHAFVEEDEVEDEANASADDKDEDEANPSADGKDEDGANASADGKDEDGANASADGKIDSDSKIEADTAIEAQADSLNLAESTRERTACGAAAPAESVDVADAVAVQPSERSFSWKRDFGNPDEMIDGLGAQRTLEVIDGDTGLPVSALGNRFDGDAAEIQPGSEEEAEQSGENLLSPEPTSGQGATQPEKKPLLGDKELAISMVLGLVLGIALFIIIPAALTNLIVGEYDDKTLLWNIVDGVLRIGVFIFYIWLIGRMSDIKRMFGYHGAEHKTIHCFEHGLPLTPENARSFPRLHVRCGTAFLIMVMIIAIFVYTSTPLNALIGAWGVPDGPAKLALVIVVRILLMPVIAGISYEITVKWAGSHPDNPLVKVILWPGMQMQYLTTREPDDDQIECAIAAMQIVLEREQREEAAAA